MTGIHHGSIAAISSGLSHEHGDTWRDSAACATVDPELFFPDQGAGTKEAKTVCARCDVIEECLRWALDNNVTNGIWGGLAASERRLLRKPEAPTVRQEKAAKNQARAIELYNDGARVDDIAGELGVTAGTVARYLKAAGVGV